VFVNMEPFYIFVQCFELLKLRIQTFYFFAYVVDVVIMVNL